MTCMRACIYVCGEDIHPSTPLATYLSVYQQGREKQSRAGKSRAGQGRTGQGRAKRCNPPTASSPSSEVTNPIDNLLSAWELK